MPEQGAIAADGVLLGTVGAPHSSQSEGETSRSKPDQVNSLSRTPLWQCFEDWLPARPYCTDEPTHGLLIRSRRLAVRRAFLQLNTPHTHRWLCFDIDRPGAAFADEDANVAAPNVAVINPDNGHAHLLYALADPVHATAAARQAPLRFLADIERGMQRRLGGDPGYSGVIAKNPRSRRWLVRWAALYPYRLEHLDGYLTREDKRRLGSRAGENGLGRNCTLFDAVRRVAYREARDFRRRGMSQRHFQTHLENLAAQLNLEFYGSLPGPLSPGEVLAIARSIAKYCYRYISAERFAAIQRYRAETRTRRHMRLIEMLKRGGT